MLNTNRLSTIYEPGTLAWGGLNLPDLLPYQLFTKRTLPPHGCPMSPAKCTAKKRTQAQKTEAQRFCERNSDTDHYPCGRTQIYDYELVSCNLPHSGQRRSKVSHDRPAEFYETNYLWMIRRLLRLNALEKTKPNPETQGNAPSERTQAANRITKRTA